MAITDLINDLAGAMAKAREELSKVNDQISKAKSDRDRIANAPLHDGNGREQTVQAGKGERRCAPVLTSETSMALTMENDARAINNIPGIQTETRNQ